MKKYICTVCDWVYDPEVGDPEGGIAPGTACGYSGRLGLPGLWCWKRRFPAGRRIISV